MNKESIKDFFSWRVFPIMITSLFLVGLPVLVSYIIASCVDANFSVPILLGYADVPMTPRIQNEVYSYAFANPSTGAIVTMIVTVLVCIAFQGIMYKLGILQLD